MPGATHKYSASVHFFLNLKAAAEEQAVYCLHRPKPGEKHVVDLSAPFQYTQHEPKTIKKLFPTIGSTGRMEYLCCFEVSVFILCEGYDAAMNALNRINEHLSFDEKQVSSAYCTVDLNQDLTAFPFEKNDLDKESLSPEKR